MLFLYETEKEQYEIKKDGLSIEEGLLKHVISRQVLLVLLKNIVELPSFRDSIIMENFELRKPNKRYEYDEYIKEWKRRWETRYLKDKVIFSKMFAEELKKRLGISDENWRVYKATRSNSENFKEYSIRTNVIKAYYKTFLEEEAIRIKTNFYIIKKDACIDEGIIKPKLKFEDFIHDGNIRINKNNENNMYETFEQLVLILPIRKYHPITLKEYDGKKFVKNNYKRFVKYGKEQVKNSKEFKKYNVNIEDLKLESLMFLKDYTLRYIYVIKEKI